MSVVIRVENVSKKYQLGRIGTQSLRGDLQRWWARQRGKEDPFAKVDGAGSGSGTDFWALRDVSFDIHRGEAIGIIGKNGAGKSTLLKILSRITLPTAGRVRVRGRIASLLEVGTGFNPDLTGRENIYLNGAILGMTKREVKGKFDEIVQFSGVEKFIDTPVKRYSSGMYVRLAFAVAAHLESEILILDEVLAVGDVEFQKKCLSKMDDVAHKEGRTVIFVSHSMQAVSHLTRQAILLAGGKVQFCGPTMEAISAYIGLNAPKGAVYEAPEVADKPTITHVRVVTSLENNVQLSGDTMEVVIKITTSRALQVPSLSFRIHNESDISVTYLWFFEELRSVTCESGVIELVCHIPKLRLYMGKYNVTVNFSEQLGRQNRQTLENICPFEVKMYGRNHDFDWAPDACLYLEDSSWTINTRTFNNVN